MEYGQRMFLSGQTLDGVDLTPYGVEDFWSLPEEPEIANISRRKMVILLIYPYRGHSNR